MSKICRIKENENDVEFIVHEDRSFYLPLFAPALIYMGLIAVALVWVSMMQGNAEKWIICVIPTLVIGAPLSFLGQAVPWRIDYYGIFNSAVAGGIQWLIIGYIWSRFWKNKNKIKAE